MVDTEHTNTAGQTGETEAGDALEIRNLHVNVAGKEILKGVNLTLRKGQVHAIMGPNGSGKSTLAFTLMGHPAYEVTDGEVWFKGYNILELEPDERARLGVFLAFQYPSSVPGVSVANFLRQAINARRGGFTPRGDGDGTENEPLDAREKAKRGIPLSEFRKLMREKMRLLKLDEAFAGRYLNEGFSGGEKKRVEILQMAVLNPEMAILDETDSGLDIDALRVVADGVNSLIGPNLGVLVITHYQRLLNYIKPQVVHVMVNGRIVRSGGPELALELEQHGYDWVRDEQDTQDSDGASGEEK